MLATLRSLTRFLDNRYVPDGADPRAIRWTWCLPFVLLHVACLAVFAVGFSWVAAAFAALLFVGRMFAITGFYHRYFSHRAFETSRAFQFLMAVAGLTALQRGPLWWAAHHRHHHRHADDEQDVHSVARHGFLWAHLGWFHAAGNLATKTRLVRDLARYPELRFLDRFAVVVAAPFFLFCYAVGAVLEHVWPALGTSGWQTLVWGFVVSTVLLYHATYTINSLAHSFGTRRYATRDDSRNNLWLALLTLGEGWHNNHHHYPSSARQGFAWWELDATYWGLRLLERLGLVWNLRPVPARVFSPGRARGAAR